MTLNYTRTAAAIFWVLAICAIGLVLGMTSLTGWTVLAGLALLPPFLFARLRRDDPSMSESIRDALR
jgi:hypothetical protein